MYLMIFPENNNTASFKTTIGNILGILQRFYLKSNEILV